MKYKFLSLVSQLFPNNTQKRFINVIFLFQVVERDGLPDAMCTKCLSALDQVKEFQDQCKRSDDVLRQYLQAKQAEVTIAITL